MAPKRFGKHFTAFSDKNGSKYGLKITARHPDSSNVASLACKFCIALHHEDSVGAKRKRTTDVKAANKAAFGLTTARVIYAFNTLCRPIWRFPMLKEFCGGIATVFPNSTTVEADFSLLGLEKNEYGKALTDLSL